MHLNTTQLKNIANEVRRNPLWGMLLLSEYVAADHPLFRACANRAAARLRHLPSPTLSETTVREILNGTFQSDPTTISAHLRLQADVPGRRPYRFQARDIPLTLRRARRSSAAFETRFDSAIAKAIVGGARTGQAIYSAGKPRRRRSFKIRS